MDHFPPQNRSTTPEPSLFVVLTSPPAKTAQSPKAAEASRIRPWASRAVDHSPVVTLNASTSARYPSPPALETKPPANSTTSSLRVVAVSFLRPTLRRARGSHVCFSTDQMSTTSASADFSGCFSSSASSPPPKNTRPLSSSAVTARKERPADNWSGDSNAMEAGLKTSTTADLELSAYAPPAMYTLPRHTAATFCPPSKARAADSFSAVRFPPADRSKMSTAADTVPVFRSKPPANRTSGPTAAAATSDRGGTSAMFGPPITTSGGAAAGGVYSKGSSVWQKHRWYGPLSPYE
mmetsp:Transcript_19494/g.50728  ORF Transcript_19494/g.50728 Transcript_19494/m.50728 type:complete len:294 (-) Transcript_19494:222-1103(-)